jgi:peptide/nickel transport system ATP-binding protein
MRPDVLLLDEPTSALDNIVAFDVMSMLVKFLDSFAILLITHDMDLAVWCGGDIINIGKQH